MLQIVRIKPAVCWAIALQGVVRIADGMVTQWFRGALLHACASGDDIRVGCAPRTGALATGH